MGEYGHVARAMAAGPADPAMNHSFDETNSGRRPAPARARGWLAFAALCFLVASCAAPPPKDDEVATPRQVFTVGFENLSERYVEPVDTAAVTLAGLNRLATFDSSVRLIRAGNAIRVEVGDETRAEHAAPATDDIYGWAWLAADLVADVQHNSAAIARLDNEAVYEAVFAGAMAGFDRYSRYTSPEVARRNRAARDGFGGIGISIAEDEGTTVVTQVHKDTPAARGGLRVDDRITHVDGKPIEGLPLNSVVDRLRGPVESAVTLRVERAGLLKPFDITLRRTHIVLPTVTARRSGGLLEIKLSGFNQGTARSLKRELQRADHEMRGHLSGIILDMRGNPGGLLDQAVAVADLFLDRGRIISTRGRHAESNQIFDATPGELDRGVPMAVLINGRSASAAEIVAVALRDSGRAVMIGSASYGKGTVQTIVRLPNGAEMTLTWAKMMAPSGQTLDHQGIVPALCTSGGDHAEVLLRALAAAGRTGTLLPPELVQPEAGHPHFSKESSLACPATVAESPAEIEVARIVLENHAIYAQVVSDAPNVAKRQ
jgi:carboxyl-terminal processing protease